MDVELQLNGQIIFYPHNADRQIDSKEQLDRQIDSKEQLDRQIDRQTDRQIDNSLIDTTYFILCNCKEFN